MALIRYRSAAFLALLATVGFFGCGKKSSSSSTTTTPTTVSSGGSTGVTTTVSTVSLPGTLSLSLNQ